MDRKRTETGSHFWFAGGTPTGEVWLRKLEGADAVANTAAGIAAWEQALPILGFRVVSSDTTGAAQSLTFEGDDMDKVEILGHCIAKLLAWGGSS